MYFGYGLVVKNQFQYNKKIVLTNLTINNLYEVIHH